MKRRLLVPGLTAVILSGLMAVNASAANSRSANRLTEQDKTFLEEAGHGARYEIMAGRQAADRVATPAVAAFARRMVADHSREYDDLVGVGRSVGAAIPDKPDPPQQRILELFGQVKGATLDCAYAPQEFSDHENDVARFTMEANEGSHPAVRAFARRHLPTLRSHLDDIEKSLDAIKGC
jgi:putative membrane protein